MANVAVTKLTEKDLGSIGQYFENVRKKAYELFERRGASSTKPRYVTVAATRKT